MNNSNISEFKKILFDIDSDDKVQEDKFSVTLTKFFDQKLKLHEEEILKKSIIYYNLPFWWILSDDRKERWIKKFPQYNANEEIELQYSEFFKLAIDHKSSIIDFTITEFACNKLRNIPEFIHINFSNSDKPSIKIKSANSKGLNNINIDFRYPIIDRTLNLKDVLSAINELPSDSFFEDNLMFDNSDSRINDNTFLNLYKFLILNKFIFKDISHVLFLLSKILIDNKGRERSFGGIILALNDNFNFEATRSTFDNYWLRMNIKFREWAIWQWTVKQRRDLIYHSMRSAVAAIMGRNMSHNIGSHVLSNLKNETKKIAETISDNKNRTTKDRDDRIEQILNKLAPSDKKTISDDIESHTESNILSDLEIQDNFFYGISWFINYLQERQDYIATLSGFENQTFIPVNFKSFIFDGFLPDDHYLRHIGGESINPHKNFLLEHIATSENLKRENIKFSFRDFKSSDQQQQQQSIDFLSFNLINHLNVSLPGGILGRQAFFSILENFIRNAAKHSMKNNSGNLEIKLDSPHLDYDSTNNSVKLKINDKSVFPDSGGIIRININGKEGAYKIVKTGYNSGQLFDIENNKSCHQLIFDNICKLFYIEDEAVKTYIYDYNPQEYILFSLSDNLKSFENAKNELMCAINDPIIDKDTGLLNSKYKGIKEMRISALWMRGLKIPNLADEQFPPIIQLRPSNEGSIEYVFYLLKPKELLIVLDSVKFEEISLKYNQLFEKLKNSGIEFIEEAKINNISNFRHTLFVLEASIFKDVDKSKFNQRIIKSDFSFIKNVLSGLPDVPILPEENIRNFIAEFWNMKVGINYPTNNISIHVYDNEFSKRNNYFKKLDILDKPNADVKILFSKHNDTKNLFLQFLKENDSNFPNLLFIEGISGGNSTDLYLRKLPKDKLLYYKLLESCITNVLIIDERIWNNNSSFSINKIELIDFSEMNMFLNSIKNLPIPEWKEKLKAKLISIGEVTLKSLATTKSLVKKTINTLIQLQFVNSEDHILLDNNYTYNLYKKKNIQILNVYFNEIDNLFRFYNLNKEKYFELDMNKCENKFENSVIGKPIFDVVCIHQGIIDKIYEKSHLKIEDIFKEFSNLFDGKIKIIHSGRSKPASEIPDDFFFLPYSSIENAFYDCKFSLTEVLFNVKKEAQ